MHKSVFIQSDNIGLPLVDRIENLMQGLESIAVSAAKAKQWSASVFALREVRACLEVIGKIKGEILPANQQIRVGVAVNVSAVSQAREISDGDLELRIAQDVSEATDGFNEQAIARMKRLLERNNGRLLDVQHAAS
jgi:hypothetical protein